jgi:hypothetical protein
MIQWPESGTMPGVTTTAGGISVACNLDIAVSAAHRFANERTIQRRSEARQWASESRQFFDFLPPRRAVIRPLMVLVASPAPGICVNYLPPNLSIPHRHLGFLEIFPWRRIPNNGL